MLVSAAVAIAETRIGKYGERTFSGRPHTVMERSYIAFKSSAWIVVLSGFVEPLLYLFSFGYGLGKFIGSMNVGHGHVVSYAAYIAPALLATSAMNGAIYDSTFNVFWKIKFDRIYEGMLATSLGPLDVALGEIGWALLRGFAYAVGFTTVIVPMGLIRNWWGILAIPAAVLIAFGFAAIGMAITTYMNSFQQMNMIQVVMLPMFLFSGSFYPLSVYPHWTQEIIKALPLWHAITLVRSLTLGDISMGLLPHIAYFLVMIFLGLFFTTRRLTALFMR
ncbi:MAG: ABC transporter permease [Actinomycetes bacterium]